MYSIGSKLQTDRSPFIIWQQRPCCLSSVQQQYLALKVNIDRFSRVDLLRFSIFIFERSSSWPISELMAMHYHVTSSRERSRAFSNKMQQEKKKQLHGQTASSCGRNAQIMGFFAFKTGGTMKRQHSSSRMTTAEKKVRVTQGGRQQQAVSFVTAMRHFKADSYGSSRGGIFEDRPRAFNTKAHRSRLAGPKKKCFV